MTSTGKQREVAHNQDDRDSRGGARQIIMNIHGSSKFNELKPKLSEMTVFILC